MKYKDKPMFKNKIEIDSDNDDNYSDDGNDATNDMNFSNDDNMFEGFNYRSK